MDTSKDKVLTREERKIAIEEKIKEILELTHQDGENLGFVGCFVDREGNAGNTAIAGYGKNVVVALCNILSCDELKGCLQIAQKILAEMEVKKSVSELLDELNLR